jgi:hypothetical protein
MSYTKITSFTPKDTLLSGNPNKLVRGSELDAEFDAIAAAYVIGTDIQAYDAQLTDIAGLTPTDNGVVIGNGTNFVVESGATLKTSLGLTIGTDVQAYDAQLADVAGLTPTDNGVIIGNGTNFVVESGATLKTSLGLTIGTDVQAYDADLTTWAGITPGTGVATALAVNVGSAGAPVVLNGAGGTPSSITLTNATGTAASLTAGLASGLTGTPNITVGSVTASSIDGVTVDTTTNKVVTAASLAGGTLPGSFTTLSATGDATIHGLTVGMGAYDSQFNTAVGKTALTANVSGDYITAIGHTACLSNTTGARNTAVGSGALEINISGSFNTAVGWRALNNATVDKNTAFGYSAGTALTTGIENTFIGFTAGSTATSGSNNILLGAKTVLSAISASNETVIGNSSTASTKLGGGLLDLSAATSGQIKFPATQNDSADANTLDDYEEGTWTPVYSPNAGSFTTMTMSTLSPTYTKFGNRVSISALVRTSDVSVGTASGVLSIVGLPFSSTGWSGIALSRAESWGGDYPIVAYANSSSTQINLYYRTTVNGTDIASNVSDLTTGASAGVNSVILAGTYCS